jgi:hypothetical protein
MDNLRRALSLRFCRQDVRRYRMLVDELNEVIGVQAEQLADMRELLMDHKRMARDMAALALDLCPEGFDAQRSLAELASRLRDQVALAEEHEL